jgi:hypothetical protein
LSFAKLLVELETGEEIEGLPIDEKSETIIFRALRNYNKKWSKHHLSPQYAKALDACIMFQKYLKEDQLKTPQTTIQDVILTHIVGQLEIGINLDQNECHDLEGVPIKSQEPTQDLPQLAALPVNHKPHSTRPPQVEVVA